MLARSGQRRNRRHSGCLSEMPSPPPPPQTLMPQSLRVSARLFPRRGALVGMSLPAWSAAAGHHAGSAGPSKQ